MKKNQPIKLYRGSAKSIAEKYSYKEVELYIFALQLKSLFPYSYISNYKSKIKLIAKELNKDRRTIANKLNRLIDANFAYKEGGTLRIISNQYIKSNLAKKRRNKYGYTLTDIQNIKTEVKLQPIQENIKKQQKEISRKSNLKNSKNHLHCKSYFTDLIKINPDATPFINTSTLLSQSKAAKLLGYKSKSSGQRQLKKLKQEERLQIISNKQEITREQFNFFKKTTPQRLLIKGTGNKAKFYYCLANTVNLLEKKNTEQVKETEYKKGYYTSTYFLSHF